MKTLIIKAKKNHGAIRAGQTFTAQLLNAVRPTQKRVVLVGLPNCTKHPILFTDESGKPNGFGNWDRFEIVDEAQA